ncbi:MAG: DUF503 domain-containing protein [Chloroflexota bacterium]
MPTTIGIGRATLYFEDTFSLKDKRHSMRSVIQQVRNRFNAAIAETGDLDDLRAGSLTFAVVSNSAPHADEMLQKIIGFIETRVELGVLGEVETELIPIGG